MRKRKASRHPLKNIRAFRNSLTRWFGENAKSYPWRQTTDPWAILVSEVMLQQTTVASVIANKRFEKFLDEFPDVFSMTRASEGKILKAWEGLGYYNRVRNLQKTARAIVENHDGRFPVTATELEKLPGIGRYTAGAVSSFSFNQAYPIVDGNIARVLARIFDFHKAIDSTSGQKAIWQLAEQLLDRSSPRSFNSAIMELGQTNCGPRKVSCESCPVQDFCQTSTPLKLPVKKPRQNVIEVTEYAFLFVQDGSILLSRESGSRRKGFWHLPLRDEQTCAHLSEQSRYRYMITNHRVTVLVFHSAPPSIRKDEQFHSLDRIDDLPIASPIRKIIMASL